MRKTYVYDKIQKKVVLSQERTDRPRGAPYIKQKFATRHSLQLGHPADVKAGLPHTGYSSWDDLEAKAHARGFEINAQGSEGDIDG